MAIIAVLDMHFAADTLDEATSRMPEIVATTRAFAGCLRVEVSRDLDDPAHFLLYQEWESLEHDTAYRTWRKGEGSNNFPTLYDRPVTITRWRPTTT